MTDMSITVCWAALPSAPGLFFQLAEQHEAHKCSVQVGGLWAFTPSHAATQADSSFPLLPHMAKTSWQEEGRRCRSCRLQLRIHFPLDAA